MNGPASRLFIALWPTAQLRHDLLAWRNGWQWPKSATPVHADKLHVTLYFLGDVETARIPELAAALDIPFEPFELRFGRNVIWHKGIAVLEPDETPVGLLALHASLGKVIDDLGMPRDARPYKPHVTLARRAAAGTVMQPGPAIAWKVDSFALMQSANDYTSLREYGRVGTPCPPATP